MHIGRALLHATFALSAAALNACSGEQSARFRMYATTQNGGSTPNTLIAVDTSSGRQVAIGQIGATPAQTSLAYDPVSGFLYGVNVFDNPGVITRIDPATGKTTVAATFPSSPISTIAFSPDGQMYALEIPGVLSTVDLSTPGLHGLTEIMAGNWIQSMDFRSDGTLYALAFYDQPDPLNDSYSVLTVSPVSADPIVTSTVPLATHYLMDDIAFAPDGYIYATAYSTCLIRVNPRRGDQISMGCGDLGPLGGLAVVP
jgi:WD40 repeat protein